MSSKNESAVRIGDDPKSTLHFAKRGEVLEDDAFVGVSGFDAERMRARTLLTAEQEKKLLRRIDWHIMPLCALMFLMKNLDANNVCPRQLHYEMKNELIERSGFEYSHHESWNFYEYSHTVGHDRRWL